VAYDNSNTGMMYRNDNKEQDSHPDFNGFINIGGQEYWLSGWIKEGKEGSKFEGRKFFSLAFKPKEEKKVVRGRQPSGGAADMDDDIPFAPIAKGIGGHAL
jgi:hypothetical protein